MAQYAAGRSTPNPHTNTLQDVSGTLSIIVEAIMVIVNVFPIIVAVRRKKQNEGLLTDDLIIALSTTDILSVVIPTPFGLVSYFNKNWFGGKATCEFYQLTILWFQVVSILLITWMCLDRFLALRMVLFYKVSPLSTGSRAKYLVLVIYLFALLLVSLPLMGLAPPAMSTSVLLCESWITSLPKTDSQSVFYISLLSVGYGNLLLVMVVNFRVTSLMWKLERKLQSLSGRVQTSVVQLHRDRKTIVEFTWMVVTVTILFYLTWFPTMLMLTMQKVGYKVSDIAILYALLSTTLTGLLNPLIYGLFSKSYRRGYRHILTTTYRFCCPCMRKEFQPIPAITCERGAMEEKDIFTDRKTEDRNALKRSRSLHDRPFGFGFYNYGFHTSLYSALTDYQLTRGVSKSSVNIDLKGCKRRARSLTPPARIKPVWSSPVSVQNKDGVSSTDSDSSKGSAGSEADLEYEDEHSDNETDHFSMQETCI